VLSSAPWLPRLTSLALAYNDLGAPGHRALSLLHLPRLQGLSLDCNGFDGAGLAALVSAQWLTQLTKLTLYEMLPVSSQSCEDLLSAINDDAWVFGRLRRLGCTVDADLVNDPADPPGDDEPGGG
jgi:hypothetical protein